MHPLGDNLGKLACALEEAMLAFAPKPVRLVCALGRCLHHLTRSYGSGEVEVDACDKNQARADWAGRQEAREGRG